MRRLEAPDQARRGLRARILHGVAGVGRPIRILPRGRSFHWSLELPKLHLRERVQEIWLRIYRTANPEKLIEVGREILGAGSFDLGFCVGIFENLAGSIAALVRLGKTFLLAGLYDAAHLDPILAVGPAMLLRLEAKAIESFAGTAMKEAHSQRNAILQELQYAVTHADEVFGQIGKEYQDRWNLFKAYFAQGTISGDFEAGKLAGNVLVDVLTLILTVVDGIGLVKIAARLPELARVADGLRGAEGLLAERRAVQTMVMKRAAGRGEGCGSAWRRDRSRQGSRVKEVGPANLEEAPAA